ncbi:DUF4170 domain-containing protein [Thalassobaculum sp.]|jgi:hypothetical protein|uniref:DUF4170 domain-containing protein n=1 Tax=Thalassobaculum sp. TaxID=2022740 RepID=UPI003B5A5ED4
MSNNRFWVIGGEYASTAFDRVVEGTERILGPYLCREEAHRAWEEVAVETRSVCLARFTIVQEGARAA